MKKNSDDKTIWTIGHSTRSPEEFLEMLHSFEIDVVADIRSFPGSRRFPHFNKEALEIFLTENKIQYIHLKKLGGRRKAKPDSKNTGWKNLSFQGYADHMETVEFKEGIKELEKIALSFRVAYMCSESLWWSCHRSLVSDYLKFHGWKAMHIMKTGKADEHEYTSPAKILNEELSYITFEKENDENISLFPD